MARSVFLVAISIVAAVGCGSVDDRPPTLQYVTEAILKPTCGSAACHSSFKMEKGYAFDTVEATRASFQNDPVLVDVDNLNSDVDPTFITNVTKDVAGAPRMPYDAPMPNADVSLIALWLDAGLPGICATGAKSACLGNQVWLCRDDASYDLQAGGVACTSPHATCVAGACQ